MRKPPRRRFAAGDSSFRASLKAGRITVASFVGPYRAIETYIIDPAEWPTREFTDSANAYAQRKFVEDLIGLWQPENLDDHGQMNRNVDCIVDAVNDCLARSKEQA